MQNGQVNETVLIALVVLGIVVFVLVSLIDRVPALAFFKSDPRADIRFPKRRIGTYFKNPKIQKRFVWTLLFFVIYIALSFIPLLTNDRTQAPLILKKFNLDLMMLGVIPYLIACWLSQIIASVVTPLKKHLGQVTLMTALLIAVIMIINRIYFFNDTGVMNFQNGIINGLLIFLGFLIALRLMFWITQKGLAHGGVILFIPKLIQDFSNIDFNKLFTRHTVISIFVTVMLAILAAIYLTKWRKTVSAQKSEKAFQVQLPLVSFGVVPVFLGIVIMSVIVFFTVNYNINIFIKLLSYSNTIISMTLIIAIAYLYSFVVYRSKKYSLSSHIKSTLFSGFILAVFTYLPVILSALFHLNFFFNFVLMLMAVGTITSIAAQMRGVLDAQDLNCSEVHASTHDFIEAQIIKQELAEKNIESVIVPTQFDWVLPRSTALDQYQIMTQSKH